MKTLCGGGTCSCAKFHSDPNLCYRGVIVPDNLRLLVSRNKREGQYWGKISRPHIRGGPNYPHIRLVFK